MEKCNIYIYKQSLSHTHSLSLFFLVLCRLNALSSLGEEFDPTSTKPEDVRAFRRCVEKYQAWARVVCPCGGGGSGGGGGRGGGVLCPHTIARISEHIRHFHVN